MSMKFKLHRDGANPTDTLDDAANVLDMLDAFLASVDDLQNFQRNDRFDPVGGLNAVIRQTRAAVASANEELSERLKNSVDLSVGLKGIVEENAFRDAGQRAAWRSGFDAGVVAYSEAGKGRPIAPPVQPVPSSDAADDASNESDKISISKTPGAEADTYPRLSARDHAIASAVKEGYDLPEVAKAVNLKRATVERIVAQLRNDGVLPEADGEADQLRSATA